VIQPEPVLLSQACTTTDGMRLDAIGLSSTLLCHDSRFEEMKKVSIVSVSVSDHSVLHEYVKSFYLQHDIKTRRILCRQCVAVD
jgi:hypothetical protein